MKEGRGHREPSKVFPVFLRLLEAPGVYLQYFVRTVGPDDHVSKSRRPQRVPKEPSLFIKPPSGQVIGCVFHEGSEV